ncbi:MAG TPA: PBP1A family penicillin-binding protein [Firmicutes bacterium]|nr:PBP1A family penicillin-binding protein [Bacillota bacterium]
MAGQAGSRRLNRTKPTKRLSVGRLLLVVGLIAFVCGTGLVTGFVITALKQLDSPAFADLRPTVRLSSQVFDANGKLFAELFAEENRILVPLKKVPIHVRNAFLATEDATFYTHHGINPKAILRALYVILTGKGFQGGSTITQQLAKNAFLSPEVSLKRKVQEAFLAIEIERRYTKDEILEMYLNQIPFGNGAYGIQAAADTYFNKDVSQLTLAEGAFLAGIIQAPSAYDPYTRFSAAKQRQLTVLNQMVKFGFIQESEAKAAAAEELKIVKKKSFQQDRLGAYFYDYVLSYLLEKYGAEKTYNGGLKVYTTFDPAIQEKVDAAVKKVMDSAYPMKEGQPYPEAAVVVIDPHTGYIKAMLGGRTHTKLLGLNRALRPRQPGSAIKPIIDYAPAIELGYSPGNAIDDTPVTFPEYNNWSPSNYSHTYMGLVTLREALVRSLNVPAAKLLYQIGVKTGVDYAIKMGLTTLVTSPKNGHTDYVPSAALGGLTEGVTPLDMATAFGVLANKGIKNEPVAILKVLDADGNVLEEHVPKPKRVLSEQTAWTVTNMLEGVINLPYGTGTAANIGRPAAGKTGTTSDYRDAWFVGYTPDLVCSVWIGYDKDLTMEKDRVTGGTYPARIWRAIMSAIPAQRKDFPQPQGFIRVKICKKSGKLPGPFCPAEELTDEIFLKGREPTETCDVHVMALVCAENPSELAGPFCPTRVAKVFIRRPQAYDRSAGVPADASQELPAETCHIHTGAPSALPVPPALPTPEPSLGG